jgi:chitinase
MKPSILTVKIFDLDTPSTKAQWFAGIDIDYEYPGQPGASGNTVDVTHDTTDFLSFLQLLRTVLPPGAVITAAALDQPWTGPDGKPLADVSAFGAALDWFTLMNYDVWGSSADPGPNAPLADSCGNSRQPGASAAAAVRAWTAAGVPSSKLVLGLPSYGYLQRSANTVLHDRRSGMLVLTNADGGSDSGQLQFRTLVAAGALEHFGATAVPQAFMGAQGFERMWDACSSTPFLRSATAGQVVTYDDPTSIGLKAAFAAQQNLRGVNLFDVHGDTDEWDLTDAARQAFLATVS